MTRSPVAASPSAVAEAARLLRDGALVALPTETVYGLAADATQARAVAAVFAVKRRPRFNPLIVHTADIDAARAISRFDQRGEALAASFWPGPLTLVLPKVQPSPLADLVSAGLDTVAVRVPAHPVAQAVLAAAGRPLAAPSANRYGSVSPTTAAHVADELGSEVALIVDGGPCPVGVESSIVDLTGATPILLRPGGVERARLEAVVGPLAAPGPDAPVAPGSARSHYSPSLPVRLDAASVRADEALLAFGQRPLRGAAATLNLSPAGDLVEAAANLFAMLRALDRPTYAAIAVMPIPSHGLGEAIIDRLRRAAAPRPG